MAKDFGARFRIKPGDRVRLGKRDPADLKGFPDKRAARAKSIKDGIAIAKLQDRLYAEHSRALLVILQGVDTAGKDGTIDHVFKETGPRGVMVTPFRHPTEEELAHDFLWRAHRACPRRQCKRTPSTAQPSRNSPSRTSVTAQCMRAATSGPTPIPSKRPSGA